MPELYSDYYLIKLVGDFILYTTHLSDEFIPTNYPEQILSTLKELNIKVEDVNKLINIKNGDYTVNTYKIMKEPNTTITLEQLSFYIANRTRSILMNDLFKLYYKLDRIHSIKLCDTSDKSYLMLQKSIKEFVTLCLEKILGNIDNFKNYLSIIGNKDLTNHYNNKIKFHYARLKELVPNNTNI